MFISPITNFNSNNRNTNLPSHKGLTKALKNKIYIDGQKDIEKMMLEKVKTNPVVGQLPNFIFKKLPKENRREAILDILKVFDNVANTIREFCETSNVFVFEHKKKYRPDSVNKMLTDVFKKYKILYPWDEIELQYIDQGGKGKVFKLEGLRDPDTEDEYVIKVFHQLKGKEWHPFKSHGCYAEINNGMYWRNQEGHDTHRGKFFFASLGSGYIVSKFLDEDVRLPERIVPEYKYGIKCTDEEKEGAINGYNRIKGYNYDYGGMRVVNRLKNADKVARKKLEKIKELSLKERVNYWHEVYMDRRNSDSDFAGITLGIKYLDNKNYYIDKCLKLNKPKVDQALAYVLKYLDNYDDQLRYFETLAKRKDKVTQIILFNEIPLLAKRKDENKIMQDDINASLHEIFPEKIYDYYMIAEHHAIPETVEHLASFVHLLPRNKVKQQYTKISNIQNPALQERLIYKLNYLTEEIRNYAVVKLAYKVKDKELQERLLRATENISKDKYDLVKYTIEHKQKD